MIECIYLDMDGVLSDFVSASLAATGIPLTHDEVQSWNYFTPFMSEIEFWRKIDSVDGFWDKIEPYTWASSLVEMCELVAPVYFCSSPSLHHVSASAKIKWLRDYGLMGRGNSNYVLTSHKHMLAGPRRVLIDDGTHQIEAFNNAGGIGITFPQPWNSAACATGAGRQNVIASRLEEICNQLSGQKLFGKNNPGESILAEAERLTGVDRHADYGKADEDFTRTAGMWTAMLQHKLASGVKFESWEVAQMMICIKLSRLQHKPKRDSVVDAAGYANCMDHCYQASGGY